MDISVQHQAHYEYLCQYFVFYVTISKLIIDQIKVTLHHRLFHSIHYLTSLPWCKQNVSWKLNVRFKCLQTKSACMVSNVLSLKRLHRNILTRLALFTRGLLFISLPAVLFASCCCIFTQVIEIDRWTTSNYSTGEYQH